MKNIELQNFGVSELSSDDAKNIDGGIFGALLLGFLFGAFIAYVTYDPYEKYETQN